MSGDVHVRFCESLGLKCPGPLTHAAVATRFRELHGDKYATVGDYYKSVAGRVAIVDLVKILPALAGRDRLA